MKLDNNFWFASLSRWPASHCVFFIICFECLKGCGLLSGRDIDAPLWHHRGPDRFLVVRRWRPDCFSLLTSRCLLLRRSAAGWQTGSTTWPGECVTWLRAAGCLVFVFVFWKTLLNNRFPLLRTFPLALDVGGGKSHIAEHLSRVEWCHSGGGASFNSSTVVVVTLIIGCFRKWWSASSWRTSLRTIWWVSSCEDHQSFPRVLSLDSSLTLSQKLRLSRFNLRVYLLIILMFVSCEMVWALSCLIIFFVQMPMRRL